MTSLQWLDFCKSRAKNYRSHRRVRVHVAVMSVWGRRHTRRLLCVRAVETDYLFIFIFIINLCTVTNLFCFQFRNGRVWQSAVSPILSPSPPTLSILFLLLSESSHSLGFFLLPCQWYLLSLFLRYKHTEHLTNGFVCWDWKDIIYFKISYIQFVNYVKVRRTNG